MYMIEAYKKVVRKCEISVVRSNHFQTVRYKFTDDLNIIFTWRTDLT